MLDFNRWARARARTASPSTGSLLHRAKYLNCLNPNAAPQLSTHRTPLSPLRFFLRGHPITVPPSPPSFPPFLLYQHHRYQYQFFHSQPRCRSSRLRNYPPFVSFALTVAHHSFWAHNTPSAFPSLTIFYSSFNSSVLSTCGRPRFWI